MEIDYRLIPDQMRFAQGESSPVEGLSSSTSYLLPLLLSVAINLCLAVHIINLQNNPPYENKN